MARGCTTIALAIVVIVAGACGSNPPPPQPTRPGTPTTSLPVESPISTGLNTPTPATTSALTGADQDPFLELAGLEVAQVTALATLRQESTDPVRISYQMGRPTSVTLRVAVPGDDPIGRASEYLRRFGALYLQSTQAAPVHPRRSFEAMPGLDMVDFVQSYGDVPVLDSSFRIVLHGNDVVSTAGTLLPTTTVQTDPSISPSQAINSARTDADERIVGSPRLFVSPGLDDDGAPRLVWVVNLGGLVPERVVVDADDGAVIERRTLIQDDDSDYDFEEFDAEGGTGEYDCFIATGEHIGSEGGLEQSYFNDADAVNAWWFARYAYDWYHGLFNRHGFDGDDDQLELFVHSGGATAGWVSFCELMVFPTGRVQSDVVVHEYTHGVLDNNTWGDGLNYTNQSGALNEAYADLMGALSDTDRDWTIAEDRASGALRDFANPANPSLANPQPDHLSKFVVTGSDNGGVHANSGIANNAHYLMAVGGANATSGIAVTPFTGDEDAARLKLAQLGWLTMVFLPSNAIFQEARDFEVLFASQMAGSGAFQFTAADVCVVKNAWNAVGVPSADSDCDGTDDPWDDSDADGILDAQDNCPNKINPMQQDADGDATGNACDSDDDGDGVEDVSDNCLGASNPDQADGDTDGIGDACDKDKDSDEVDDSIDNCPTVINPNQLDSDNDATGNRCDADIDNDGLANDADMCPTVAGSTDADNDGYGDTCDPCPAAAHVGSPTFDVDGYPGEPDIDSDGVPDECDSFNGSVLNGFEIASADLFGCPPECQYETAVTELDFNWLATVELQDVSGDVTVWIADDTGLLIEKSACNPGFEGFEPPGLDDIPGGVAPEAGEVRSCSGTADVTLRFHPLVGRGYVVNYASAGGAAPANLASLMSVTEGLAPEGDGDLDGITEPTDNCPHTTNPEQTDVDGDGLGDACDPALAGTPPPTQTSVPTAGPTASPTPTATATPSQTPTPTIVPSSTPNPGPSIGPIRVSPTHVYWSNTLGCEPDSIAVTVELDDPDGVERARLRYRFVSSSGATTEFLRTDLLRTSGTLWGTEIVMNLASDAMEHDYDPATLEAEVVAVDAFDAATTSPLAQDLAGVIVCKP